jgi:hypothetical protein
MSIIYFVAGVVIGLGMLIWPGEAGYYIPVHVHLNLLGFMSMMIYGVGYHILPKFSGRNIYSPLIMKVQFWLANGGLLGMAVSWPFVVQGDSHFSESVLIASSLLTLVSVVLFAFNLLKTIKPV